MTAKNAKQYLREEVIPALSGQHKYYSLEDVQKALAENERTVDPKSLKQYMHELMVETVIYSAGRGWYSTIEQEFEVNTEPVSEIISVLEKNFPLYRKVKLEEIFGNSEYTISS